jgi:plasmid stabilization system protein ParE
MIRRIIFDPEANEEFLEAMRWYEDSRPGLGWLFLRAVDAAVSMIEKNPGIGAPVTGDVRRNLVRRFPYWIYYRTRADELRVIACFDARRDPETISLRVH